MRQWGRLLHRHPVTGGDVFDLQIVATIQTNHLVKLCTFKIEDFVVFSRLSYRPA